MVVLVVALQNNVTHPFHQMFRIMKYLRGLTRSRGAV